MIDGQITILLCKTDIDVCYELLREFSIFWANSNLPIVLSGVDRGR